MWLLLLLCGRCWTFSFSASTFFLVFRISIQRRAVGENEMGSLNISNPKWWGNWESALKERETKQKAKTERWTSLSSFSFGCFMCAWWNRANFSVFIQYWNLFLSFSHDVLLLVPSLWEVHFIGWDFRKAEWMAAMIADGDCSSISLVLLAFFFARYKWFMVV